MRHLLLNFDAYCNVESLIFVGITILAGYVEQNWSSLEMLNRSEAWNCTTHLVVLIDIREQPGLRS